MNTKPFSLFWDKYHRITKQAKLNKAQARNEWERCNFESKRIKAYNDIKKYAHLKLSALEYIRYKLKTKNYDYKNSLQLAPSWR